MLPLLPVPEVDSPLFDEFLVPRDAGWTERCGMLPGFAWRSYFGDVTYARACFGRNTAYKNQCAA